MDQLVLTGTDLTLEDLHRVVHGELDVVLDQAAVERMRASRAVIDELVASDAVVYGVTTGFGDLASKRISAADSSHLQENLLISHAVGVGPAHGKHTVRAMLLLRANALARGFSGVRPELVERLLDFLRLNIHPVVPEQGSVGASGDLAPLAHLALPLIGRGRAEVDGEVVDGAAALAKRGLTPLALAAKEGLALLNGTQQMTAVGALALVHAEDLLRTANVAAAMSVEALLGTDVAFSDAYQRTRPHPGQVAVARQVRHLLRDSALIKSHHAGTHKVQDPYSMRCVPQVHGAAWDALVHVRRVLEIEINAVTDNPLVFAAGADGNFHGEPVALAMDFMKIAVAEIGSISERRIAQLVDAKSSGLPPFLVKDAGLNSGLMLLQYTAAALVSENKVLAHPASVDSIPTSAGQEDHVSMGPIAARQASAMVRNVEHVIALELLCAAQGLDFRIADGLNVGAGVAEAHRRIREKVAHREDDRDPGPEIAAAFDLVRHAKLADLAD
jgi:histidine ammonia-lyase